MKMENRVAPLRYIARYDNGRWKVLDTKENLAVDSLVSQIIAEGIALRLNAKEQEHGTSTIHCTVSQGLVMTK
jgi:hypothetical protein